MLSVRKHHSQVADFLPQNHYSHSRHLLAAFTLAFFPALPTMVQWNSQKQPGSVLEISVKYCKSIFSNHLKFKKALCDDPSVALTTMFNP